MDKISFVVYGEPVAQGRPRATTINGHVRMYDPKKSSDYKDFVRLAAAQYAPDKLPEGPLALVIDVYKQIPKSFNKKKVEAAGRGDLRPTTKPDTDNYVKAIKDALKGVLWKDDSQVVELVARKWYGDRPRIEITLMESC